MAKSYKSNYAIWLLLFVGVSGLLFASTTSSQFFAFELTPLSYGGNIELPNILCNVKVTVQGFDKNGIEVIERQSSYVEKNPSTTFSLIGGQDNSEVEKFDISNKMRCEFINDTPEVDMTTKSSDLDIIIYAKDAKGVEQQVWNNNVKSLTAIPIVENNEKVLSKLSANTIDIKKFLDNGDYETTLRFVTSGEVKIFYDVAPSVIYEVAIPSDKVETFITLNVQKDGIVEVPPKGDDPKDEPPKGDDPKVNPLDDIEEFTKCIQSFDTKCLAQDKFLPLYIGGFGFVFLVGAVGTRKRPMFDQFGNRV